MNYKRTGQACRKTPTSFPGSLILPPLGQETTGTRLENSSFVLEAKLMSQAYHIFIHFFKYHNKNTERYCKILPKNDHTWKNYFSHIYLFLPWDKQFP